MKNERAQENGSVAFPVKLTAGIKYEVQLKLKHFSSGCESNVGQVLRYTPWRCTGRVKVKIHAFFTSALH